MNKILGLNKTFTLSTTPNLTSDPTIASNENLEATKKRSRKRRMTIDSDGGYPDSKISRPNTRSYCRANSNTMSPTNDVPQVSDPTDFDKFKENLPDTGNFFIFENSPNLFYILINTDVNFRVDSFMVSGRSEYSAAI